MKNYLLLRTVMTACAVISSVPVFAGNLTVLPARMLTSTEAAQLPTTPGVVPLMVSFKTAAAVTTSRLGQGQTPNVARGTNTDAAVYLGSDGQNGQVLTPAPQPAPPVPGQNQIYSFKQSADAVQAWATMSGEGVPYINIRGYGQFEADGHVSWRATLPLPTGQHKVYLKVTVPSTAVFGNYDSNGPARYHLRANANVLVNGHSIFFGEAVRFNETTPIPNNDPECAFTNTEETAMRLRAYGQGLGFAAQDGDINTEQPSSQSQTITFLLGTFDSTESVDVQFLLNAEAMIENQCCHKPAMQGAKPDVFCSAANAGFDYQPTNLPVFYVQ